ncbi:MAG: hypothetical protein JWM11_714 [Planctomycetaceae bacterium]|nr:hypothetical protein [Planctomycetaceae bacterium]
MRRSALNGFFISALLATLSLGCGSGNGPPLGTVTGTVTMNGEPVTGVNITFVPKDKGTPSYSGTDENGKYHLMFNHYRAGAELGTHHVLIENSEPETDDNGQPDAVRLIVKIPHKYGQHGVLSADVRPGNNTFDFTLDPNP